jgi:hypothetical protein
MEDPKSTEQMVTMWCKRGAAMDTIRARQLAEYDHRANLEQIDALLELAVKHRTPRKTSGLVEMRRLFEKAWS